ncbi:ArsR/SmtB family transcription factor [Haladaptatus caseinilyticus]|uniref:ArsR/SmtB family transcription factor n=1 Tax=Haladaptatus caseinilyticus TaxID=2993314 RepID=UPI00224B5FA3|nr:hypothetical protein [Haladaptatus caseinilyticus]
MVQSESRRLDAVFSALSDRKRRRIIDHLSKETDGTATVSELAALSDDPTHSQVHLRHVHLPRLNETKLVEYDARSETVRYRGNQSLEKVISCCLDSDPAL